jgi:hypothetical protein
MNACRMPVNILSPIMGSGTNRGTSAKMTATTISVLMMLPNRRNVSESVRLNCPTISSGSIKTGEARSLR